MIVNIVILAQYLFLPIFVFLKFDEEYSIG